MTFLVFHENWIEGIKVIRLTDRNGSFAKVLVNVPASSAAEPRNEVPIDDRKGMRNVMLVELVTPIRQRIVDILVQVLMINEGRGRQQRALEILSSTVLSKGIDKLEGSVEREISCYKGSIRGTDWRFKRRSDFCGGKDGDDRFVSLEEKMVPLKLAPIVVIEEFLQVKDRSVR